MRCARARISKEKRVGMGTPHADKYSIRILRHAFQTLAQNSLTRHSDNACAHPGADPSALCLSLVSSDHFHVLHVSWTEPLSSAGGAAGQRATPSRGVRRRPPTPPSPRGAAGAARAAPPPLCPFAFCWRTWGWPGRDVANHLGGGAARRRSARPSQSRGRGRPRRARRARGPPRRTSRAPSPRTRRSPFIISANRPNRIPAASFTPCARACQP